MKPGIETATGHLEVTVSSEMIARLDGKDIHSVYSTFWACHHAEVVARRTIEPYFELEENAVGSFLSLRHHTMAAIGTVIDIHACVESIERNRITCGISIVARATGTVIATGSQEQVVVSEARLRQLLADAI